jgi:hypothetical protein
MNKSININMKVNDLHKGFTFISYVRLVIICDSTASQYQIES